MSKAYVYQLQNGKKLTAPEFIKYLENKVFKTIRRFNLFELDDKFVVAASGGKDSITVLYLTHKYLKKKNLQNNLTALAIDEGIAGYRDKTLDFLEEFCAKHEIKLQIDSYKKSYSKSLDESVEKLKSKQSNISPCNICGTFRRTSLNTGARNLGATKVVTGHNLDDEAQNILLNIFKNNFKILARLGPFNGIIGDDKFVPRVKPLYLCTEKEIRLYTILKGFDVGFDECPFSRGSFRDNLSHMINELEDQHKGVKNSIINFYLETQKSLQDQYLDEEGRTISYCKECGEPSQRSVCNTCQMKKLVNEIDDEELA